MQEKKNLRSINTKKKVAKYLYAFAIHKRIGLFHLYHRYTQHKRSHR